MDDYVIAQQRNVTRELGQPRKLGVVKVVVLGRRFKMFMIVFICRSGFMASPSVPGGRAPSVIANRPPTRISLFQSFQLLPSPRSGSEPEPFGAHLSLDLDAEEFNF